MDTLKKFIIFLIISFKLIIYIINTTISDNSLLVYLYLIIIMVLSLKYLFKLQFTKIIFLKVMLIMIVSFIIFFLYKEDNIFLYSLLGLLLINDDNKDIVKTIFVSLVIIFSITILLGSLNILPMDEVYRTINGESQVRISLGFPNANAAFAYFIPIVLSGIYLFKNNKIFIILSLIVSIIIYNFTVCRTGFYLIILILIFSIVTKKYNINFNKNYFLICFILSILIAILFGQTKYNYVNELFSYRPWYGFQFLKEGIFSWGLGINNKLILDNLYFKLLANYSIIGILLYLYIYKMGKEICNNDKYILFAMFFFNIYNIFEAMTIGNFVLIIFLKEIFKYYGVIYEEN